MIIKALTIENFKGIREPMRVEFKPITLLFGPNSAGKSTIVHALHYAKEVLERHNLDADITQQGGDYVDLGGFRNLLFEHDERRSVRLTFEMEIDPYDELREYVETEFDINNEEDYLETEAADCLYKFHADSIKIVSVSFLITWSSIFNKPYVSEYATGLNGVDFARINSSSDGKRIHISHINFGHPLFVLDEKAFGDDVQDSMLLRLYDQIIKRGVIEPINDVEVQLSAQKDALPTFGKRLSFSRDDFRDSSKENSILVFIAHMSRLLVGPGEALRDALRSFRYLGPIRETPPRNYESPRYHEHARWSNGLAAWDILSGADASVISNVNEWLHKRLKSGYTVSSIVFKKLDVDTPLYNLLVQGLAVDDLESVSEEVRRLPEVHQIVLIDEQRNLQVMPQDVGIGISQVVPVIVVALHSNNGIVAIEQPELHIHPAFQVALGDLFISQVRERDVCFLLETHSEHLLLRMLRRIRETNEDDLPVDAPAFSPDLLAVNFVEQTDNGVSITPLKVDESGEFTNKWPRGFFPERAEELF
jgi:hypothetical protein